MTTRLQSPVVFQQPPFTVVHLCRTARRARHHAWQGSSDRPVLHNRLGLIIPTAPDIDIDALGTFTGAVLSAGTIREMTIAKARLNMETTGLPIGLASEGGYLGRAMRFHGRSGVPSLGWSRSTPTAEARSLTTRASIRGSAAACETTG